MARVISKTQVSDPGPSWPSCLKIARFPIKEEIIINLNLEEKLFLFRYLGIIFSYVSCLYWDNIWVHN